MRFYAVLRVDGVCKSVWNRAMVFGIGQYNRYLSFVRECSHSEIYSHNKLIGQKTEKPFLIKKRLSIIWHDFANYIFQNALITLPTSTSTVLDFRDDYCFGNAI